MILRLDLSSVQILVLVLILVSYYNSGSAIDSGLDCDRDSGYGSDSESAFDSDLVFFICLDIMSNLSRCHI